MRIAYSGDATEFTPNFNRIPPHVMLMDEMEGLRYKFDALRLDIKGVMQEMIYERGVGGSEYHNNKLMEATSDSNSRMKYLVSIASSSNGALVSDSKGYNILICLQLEYEEAIVFEVYELGEEANRNSRNGGPEVQVLVGKRRRERERETEKESCLNLWLNNGKLQVLPTLWEFLKMKVKQMIKTWYVGNQREKFPPFTLLG